MANPVTERLRYFTVSRNLYFIDEEIIDSLDKTKSAAQSENNFVAISISPRMNPCCTARGHQDHFSATYDCYFEKFN